MSFSPKTEQQIKQIGAKGGNINTGGMRFEDKVRVDKLIQDGKQGK